MQIHKNDDGTITLTPTKGEMVGLRRASREHFDESMTPMKVLKSDIETAHNIRVSLWGGMVRKSLHDAFDAADDATRAEVLTALGVADPDGE